MNGDSGRCKIYSDATWSRGNPLVSIIRTTFMLELFCMLVIFAVCCCGF